MEEAGALGPGYMRRQPRRTPAGTAGTQDRAFLSWALLCLYRGVWGPCLQQSIRSPTQFICYSAVLCLIFECINAGSHLSGEGDIKFARLAGASPMGKAPVRACPKPCHMRRALTCLETLPR
ncbi:hypothetical protein CC86DRAFT_168963 [Ophiobolus disseminans]|uniref:Uncharacterized protein n=1 Tax=Ophiobolus disseminans TaxID=1469910 RepID=A0A6A7AE33_9PLEO|nr:hypothetical protein CC86DRAFT_168963 [Ophiobolus disseminans]